ncbi:MAG: hypothetical protein R3E10_14180 [Gemmatimonadota bacterium]
MNGSSRALRPTRMKARGWQVLRLAAPLAVAASPFAPPGLDAQDPYRPDAFVDPTARLLYTAAAENWGALDESILRYTARIDQRIAAAIRTPLKDRVLYRNETAVRAFWDQDYDAVVQVLGTRSQYPGRSIAVREGDLDWLEDLPFDKPFEPGGDRLFFGLNDSDEPNYQPDDEDFWFAHPLASGADSLYRFQSGDTLTLSLPGGRQLRTVQLDVIPRRADVHRITGSLWIEPESGALVRAVFRLSQQFDAMRDVPELQEEEEAGEFKYVPGLFKPWTFDLTMIAVDYALWDFRTWLPRSMRLEGEAAAGILKFPVSMDVAYQIESVTMAENGVEETVDLSVGSDPSGAVRDVHFKTRAEAMAFIAQLLSDGEPVAYEQMSRQEPGARGRESLLLVPEERSQVAESPYLPPPIWEEAEGFPSDEDLEEFVRTLADLPAPRVEGIPWSANWGWARPDLIRYNRIEGPAIGGRLEAAIGGPYTLGASGFFGFANLDPSLRLDLERSTVLRTLTLGAYRELQATDPRGGYLGFGNSVDAFFFGRDNGEYYRATGADLTWAPPVGARESFEFRAYAERQDAVETEAGFALFHAFDGGWDFRPNVASTDLEEVGGELRMSPWWGGDPMGAQVGLDLYGQGARWRTIRADTTSDYARASAVLRIAVPLVGGAWRVGMEAGAGTSWGAPPPQRAWFLGSASTLRGYPPSVVSGPSFTRGRLELARVFDGIGSVSTFGDVGWAGQRDAFSGDDLLYGVGVGGSLLDGLFRMDLSRGLNGSLRQWRLDLYLDAIL